MRFKPFFAGFLLTVAGVAAAATFTLFQPATGVLKGDSDSYITTAATSSDIRGLWTGTCDATTFLRGDGSCVTVSGSGTVTSVGLSMPPGFSIAGSPVTTFGTLSVTTTLNGVLHGNGTGFSASNVLLGSEVTGTLPVGNGGTGVTTLTGLALGNGASAFSVYAGTSCTNQFPRSLNASGAATCSSVVLNSDVSGALGVSNGGTNLTAAVDDNILVGNGTTWQTKAVPSCTDTGGNHLNYDTSTNTVSCGTSAPGGITGLANPTGTIGLTAVNGSATTALRSDGAPALSQSIAPTWTASHTFSQAFSTNPIVTPILLSSAAPALVWNESDVTANSKVWVQRINSNALTLETRNDAGTSSSDVMVVNRSTSGTAVTSIALGNTTDSPTLVINNQYLNTYKVVRTSDNSITNNTTLTNDPTLQFALPIGTYSVRAFVAYGSGSGIGVKYAISFTGTSTSYFVFNGTANGANLIPTPAGTGSTWNSANAASTNCSSAGGDSLILTGTVVVTVTGTLSLQFAQNTSSGTALLVCRNSWLIADRIS